MSRVSAQDHRCRKWQSQIRPISVWPHSPYTVLSFSWGFPGGSDGKESDYNAGELGLIPELGGYPGEGIGYPSQYSCLENSMDRGHWLQSMGLQRVRHDWAAKHAWMQAFPIAPSLTHFLKIFSLSLSATSPLFFLCLCSTLCKDTPSLGSFPWLPLAETHVPLLCLSPSWPYQSG